MRNEDSVGNATIRTARCRRIRRDGGGRTGRGGEDYRRLGLVPSFSTQLVAADMGWERGPI